MIIALRRAAAAAAVVAAVLTAASCSSTHSTVTTVGGTAPGPSASGSSFPTSEPLPTGTAGSPPVPLPAPSTVNDQDASAVSKAVVTIQWTMDTTIDTSQYQAELRSARFLTPSYLANVKAHPPVAAPGAQWNEWSSHRAYTTVATLAEHDDQPADSATEARRQWGITVTPHGRDGWTGSPTTATVFVTMSRARTGSPWLVSAITVSS
jgi:hypothetical protein